MPTIPPQDDSSRTRSLLGFGILAGPFYLALSIGQGLVREGFDFGRHSLSMLANGAGGWIQTANFLLTGAMVVAAAVGLRRALAPAGRGMTWMLIGYGICLFAWRTAALRSIATLSLVAGLLVLIGFYGGMAAPSIGIAGIWVTVVVGWIWLAVVSRRVRG